MSTRVTPGSGAVLNPIISEEFQVTEIQVLDGGSGYASTDPPKIEITGSIPIIPGVFYPVINSSGQILRVIILDPGFGYFPDTTGAIGIETSFETEDSIVVQKGNPNNPYLAVKSSRANVIMQVGDYGGNAIYENGYNVAISTTVSGISSSIEPDNSGILSRFWGFTEPFLPSFDNTGIGTDARFSVFIVYNSSTGDPISTSVVLRTGGRGYEVGNIVSISGTYIGGNTPENDLSFNVSKLADSIISSEANNFYLDVPSETVIGIGSGARFNVYRDSLGAINEVTLSNGGVGYALTDNISIAGTYIGGSTPGDNLFVSPSLLGTNQLPQVLYVDKLNENQFRVSGLSTATELNLTSFGSGIQNVKLEDPNSDAIITVDNIIQSPLTIKDFKTTLSSRVGLDTNKIFVNSGISSLSSKDILKIGDEYLRIINIGIGATNVIEVDRGAFGSIKFIHLEGSQVRAITGDYRIEGDEIYFKTAPYGKRGLDGLEVNSTFHGRAFSRRFDPFTPNDKNLILDDISHKFTGIAATEFTLSSNDSPVVGIFSDTNSILGSNVDINNNPIILINNIPQVSRKDFNIDTPGNNTIKFISGVPRSGQIIRVGISTGFGYVPLVGAAATLTVSVGGTISSVELTGFGSGYRTPPPIDVISEVGFGATIVATIGAAGTITSLEIVNSGFGYTTTNPPKISIGIPTAYSDLGLQYIDGQTGLGKDAKVSVQVGSASSIIQFTLEDNGIAYKVGDVLSVSGIVTDPNVGAGFSEFRVTVEEIFTDEFSGWYPGQFIQLNDISPFFNGIKRKFTMSVSFGGVTEVISLKTNPGSDLNINNNLFIYVNDILQIPGKSYIISGSRITFKEPPRVNSKCNILFYRGSDLDVEEIEPPKTIKEGDFIQIKENPNDPLDRSQDPRVVKNIVSTDALDTLIYEGLGISTDPNKPRPLTWTKQTSDKIINGVLYSKSRPSLKSRIIPNAKLIKSISKTDPIIYVDNVFPIFSELDKDKGISEDLRDVIIVEDRDINPARASAIVSTGSTISRIQVISTGSGYKDILNPEVSISKSYTYKKDPIFNWTGFVGIGTNSSNKIIYSNNFVTVGNNGSIGFSSDGIHWYSDVVGGISSSTSTISYNDIEYVNRFGTQRYVAVGDNTTIITATGIGTTVSNWTKYQLFKESQVIGLTVALNDSAYNGTFNSVAYNRKNDTWVVVGTNAAIFSGVGINTTFFLEKSITFNDLNSVITNDDIFVVVGDNGDILYSNDGNIWLNSPSVPTTKDLNDVTWDGSRFIVVGDDNTILTSTNGINWTLINVRTSNQSFKKIKYYEDFYTALNTFGDLYYSFNLLDWVYRDTNQGNPLNDLLFYKEISEEGRYIAVGSGGTSIYAEPVYNRAEAISTTTSGGVSEIIIVNGGFGYLQDTPPPVLVEGDSTTSEKILSIKAEGDFGTIIGVTTFIEGTLGIGTTSPKIEFTLKSEIYDNETLGIGYSSLNVFGVQHPGMSVGDYFIIYESNSTCGHALTGITTSLGGMSNYPESRVGTAVSFLDGVYIVESVSEPFVGIVTVGCNFAPIPGIGADIIEVSAGLNTSGFFGRYSWGKIFDYQNRSKESPKEFFVNTNNGLFGLKDAPKVYRTRGLI